MSPKKEEKMESILVTGANGQLGTALRHLSDRLHCLKFYFTDIDKLDICKPQQIAAFVKEHKIGSIVNCAAYTAVDRAEDDVETCFRINRDAVHAIGEVAASAKARVIHISTDYVFDGHGSRPYREDDPTHPTTVYGKSKLAGEQALLAVCMDTVIIRTAWLYSETGTNFVKTMLRLGAERDSIGVVTDQIGSPTYAGDLAAAIAKVLESERFEPGIYHYTNEGVCSWFEFAQKIFALSQTKCMVHPLVSADYPTRAQRPAYSVLDKTKIKATYGTPTPHWEESLLCINGIPAVAKLNLFL